MYKNPSNILRFKNTHDLKIPQSVIIYLQRNILLHFFQPRGIFHKHNMKKIVELAKTFYLFV